MTREQVDNLVTSVIDSATANGIMNDAKRLAYFEILNAIAKGELQDISPGEAAHRVLYLENI